VPPLRVRYVTAGGLLGDVVAARLAAEPDVVVDDGSGTDVVLMDTVPPATPSRIVPDGARLVVLALSGGGLDAVEAARVGASAWLDATCSADDFLRVLRGVCSGRAYYPPEVQGAVLRALRDDARPCAGPLARLTGREREVLQALAGGLGNREIGDHLGMSYNTVRTHINEIFRKLGVHSRVEAVRLLPDAAGGHRVADGVAGG
jgi:two-component system, NarL family, response regulator LiaR